MPRLVILRILFASLLVASVLRTYVMAQPAAPSPPSQAEKQGEPAAPNPPAAPVNNNEASAPQGKAVPTGNTEPAATAEDDGSREPEATAEAEGDKAASEGESSEEPADPNYLPNSLEECSNFTEPIKGTAPKIAVPWTNWGVVGHTIDPNANARSIFEAYFATHGSVGADARADFASLARAAGYQLVGFTIPETPSAEVTVTLELAPLPLIRRVDVDSDRSFFDPLYSEEVRRRMRIRIGAHVAWSPRARKCELLAEQQRIEDFLRDEGYFDASAKLSLTVQNDGGAIVAVDVTLGQEYFLGNVRIERAGGSSVSNREILNLFSHPKTCVVLTICFGKARFTRAALQADLARVAALFHRRGFPAVRVVSDYDAKTSFDRFKKQVNFTLRIDERRQLDVQFDGIDPDRIPHAKLKNVLTFAKAGSADDVEAQESAAAIAAYMQSKGYFDTRVTWIRKRETLLDRITFRIEPGLQRKVSKVSFHGNTALDDATLTEAIGTQTYSRVRDVISENPAATASQLIDDLERIRATYRKNAFRNARVTVGASPTPFGLDNAALTAADVALANSSSDLYVDFHIDEGPETLLSSVTIEMNDSADLTTPDHRTVCDSIAAVLADYAKQVSTLAQKQNKDVQGFERSSPRACKFEGKGLRFYEEQAANLAVQVSDRLQQQGRRTVKLLYEAKAVGESEMAVVLRLSNLNKQRFGKVLLRGNFRTDKNIILQQLGFVEGALLTTEQISKGAANLRATGLFDAVKIEFLDNPDNPGRDITSVVRVEEKYERRNRFAIEGGYSFIQGGVFLKGSWLAGNFLGQGISVQVPLQVRFSGPDCADVQASCVRLTQLEGNMKFPRWIAKRLVRVEFDSELSAFFRSVPTPRFGELSTLGATLSGSRTFLRSRTETSSARSITAGLRYDFRQRDRQEAALRPAGADSDQSQLPVSTRTGALVARIEWEQRTDRRGVLAQLDPEAGFRFEASLAFASPLLGGQASFIKASAAVQRFVPVGKNLILRGDLRYDQGIPLGGAALLPDVERFFSGGDNTIRGYAEDRLATEVVVSGVPPFDQIQQISVRPAGGNIRALASVDAQVRIFPPVASALFLDCGTVINRWRDYTAPATRCGVGMALARFVTGFGSFTLEYAVPIAPKIGDDPRGRWHLGFAMRF